LTTAATRPPGLDRKVQGVSHGQVPCKHCDREIRPDGQGGWVHLNAGYTCRDEANVALSTHAWPPETPPPPGWPLNAPDYRR
jgi:hypothetical protein